MSTTTRVNISIDEDLLNRIDAEAKKLGTNRSEFMRLASEEKLSLSGANDGLDTVLRAMRKVLSDEITSQFNRMAKMIAKDTKASATGMYMLLVLLENMNIDSKSVFAQSEKLGVNYLTSKE